jgi:uncharacterized protein YaeQ
MALTSTVHTFDIDLADADRGVYETLALRVARHPSETEEFLVTRVLAYALEYVPGIAFSAGLCAPEEPALSVRDATGALRAWIEVGLPDADRLHRAAKAAPRVAVYPHRDVQQWRARLAGARIHRAAEIAVWTIDLALVAALAAQLGRRSTFSLSMSDGHLFVALPGQTLEGARTRCPLP